MKLILILFAGTILSNTQCKKDYVAPACISKKIANIKLKSKWNPPAEVKEYIYNGKHVYLFTADCCDQFNELFDENCNYICAPYGGITGNGDMKCTDFSSTVQFVRMVWKDPR